uniref:NADH dehydrogenase subunit 4L n=1 Tax=Melosira undulata TaxID=2133757 RepID=A0A3G1PWE3_9STRA|nr:NADH dehydrogenase subunit 4L [Melosira undulata]AVR57557.1 NADH dehydrogenase subunit 4L [Melosira undulata]
MYIINMSINFYLTITSSLFLIGIFGLLLNKNNILIMIMSIEILLLAINLNFIIFSIHLDDIIGQLFVVFILTIAAAESAIGLAILIAYFRIKGSINLKQFSKLKL